LCRKSPDPSPAERDPDRPQGIALRESVQQSSREWVEAAAEVHGQELGRQHDIENIEHRAEPRLALRDATGLLSVLAVEPLRQSNADPGRVKAPGLGQWHSVRVVAVGDHIQAWLDGILRLDHRGAAP
jgi:hypothetical protein